MKNYLLLVVLLLCGCGGLRAQTFNLQTSREPIASLDGLWRFHTGDNPAWASPNFDDSHWPLLRSDESWTRQGYPNYVGYAWYRFTVQVPGSSKPLGLLLTHIMTGYQVYANGKQIGSAGSTAPTRDPVVAHPEVLLLPTSSAEPQTIQIALRVWEYQPFASWLGGGAVTRGSAVGDPALLTAHLHRYRNTRALRYVSEFGYGLLAAVVGLAILSLFLFRPADREYLWFAVLLLAAAVNAALHIDLNLGSMPFPLNRLLGEIAMAVSLVAALMFFSIVLNVRRSFLWQAICIAVAASPMSAALLFFPLAGNGIAYTVLLCCYLPAYIWIVVALATGALRKDTAARLLLAPAALLYGYYIVEMTWRISWQLGGPGNPELFQMPFLRYPFPLLPDDVIDYIFVLALLIFLVRRFSLARQEETRLSNELDAARTVQSLLIPVTPPSTPGFAIESVYLPASEVGGDFFQVQPGEDRSLLVVVGDVSGKGLKAAMTVSTIVGALRNEPSRQPAQVLANLNRVLHGQINGFVTCSAALITEDGRMTIANAGNLAPYRNGIEVPVESGLPLGILPDVRYSETEYQLAEDDRLTFLSDGVVEASNEERELFGFERSQAISDQPANAIAQAARQFGQRDDISVLTVRVLAPVLAGTPA